jgi:hypothetical protein
MANNCDDVFQQIQDLQLRRQQLADSREVLHSIDDTPPPGDGPQGPRDEDLARKWLFGDKQTGRSVEADFAQLDPLIRDLASGEYQDLVAGKVDAREKPLGREGQFTNFAQMVDRMGIEGAQEAGELVMALTGRWDVLKPEDMRIVTSANDRAAFTQRVADAYAEAGIRLDLGTLSQGIARDAGPFMSILDKQARLQVFGVVTKSNLIDTLEGMAKEIEATQLPPSAAMKQQFMDAAAKAIFAERSSALSRRVSGQLLQQLKGDFSQAPGLAGKAFREQLQKEAAELFNPDAKLITEDSLAGQVMQLAELGVSSLDELKELINTVRREGLDPSSKLDEGWKDNWRRQARAFYKDSLLFSGNTQFISNYLSNKTVYWMEGYRAGWNNTFSLPNTGTPFLMNLLEKPMKGMKTAWTAKLLTDDVLRAATRDALADAMPTGPLADYRGKWQQVLQDGVMKGNNPFADPKRGVEIDASTGRAMSVEEEYALANKVLYGESGKPADPNNLVGSAIGNAVNEIKINPLELPFVLRDRIHLSTKVVANHFIEGAIKKTTGKDVRLPITTALQTLAAVDSRQGMKVYTAVRANELLMQSFKDEPDLGKLSWDDRKAQVRSQLDEELYSANPSEAQVKAYREQHDLPLEVSDDRIKADIAAKHVGAPVLNTPERLNALEFSRYARMQTPPKLEILKKFDEAVQEARQNSYVDAVLPFWRSGASGMSYVTENMTPPLGDTAKMIFGKAGEVEKAKVAASWMVWLTWTGMFLGLREGLGALTSSAPSTNKTESDQWRRRNVPNTFFGIPGLSQTPLLSALMTFNDIADAVERGQVSRYDQKDMFYGLFQAFTGQLYRASGFGQFRTMNDALMSENPKQFLRAVGYIANGQLNPGSGLFRQLERAGGLGADARYQPRWDTPVDAAIQDMGTLPGGNLLKKIQEAAYYMQPLFSDQPLKDTDYLGRDLRTPAGWFKSREWPTGWPGVYNAGVHNELLKIGMLQPPGPLMTGRLDGVAMGSELEKEFNGHIGAAKGELISEHPDLRGRLTWQGKSTVLDPEMDEERTVKRRVPMRDLMDGLTDGNTLHEALNKLFQSDTWKRWQQDPRFTLSPQDIKDSTKRAQADAPRPELMNRPGAKVVKLLHDYYGSLAADKVRTSESEPAAEWRQRRQANLQRLGTEDQLEQKADDLRQMVEQ